MKPDDTSRNAVLAAIESLAPAEEPAAPPAPIDPPLPDLPAIKRPVLPVFIVMKRTNGHFEQLGQVTEAFKSCEDAREKKVTLARQHRGQIFSVFALIEQESLQPVAILEEVGKEESAP